MSWSGTQTNTERKNHEIVSQKILASRFAKNKEAPHTNYTGAPTKVLIGGRKGKKQNKTNQKKKKKKQQQQQQQQKHPFEAFSGKRET